jgi:hypothetical protein
LAKDREAKLRNEISLLEDAILYAKSKGEKDLDSEEQLLKKVRRFFEQGTWSMAERELLQAEWLRNSKWYMEFIKKREEELVLSVQALWKEKEVPINITWEFNIKSPQSKSIYRKININQA